MAKPIDYSLKKRCVKAYHSGMSYQSIFNQIYLPAINDSRSKSYPSFSRQMRNWRHKVVIDDEILETANLSYQFTPHNATVQVNAKGDIVQSWIKQKADDINYDELLDSIKTLPKFDKIHKTPALHNNELLEIPLFDVHFGVNDLDYYNSTLNNVIELIQLKKWKQIIIIVGQDLFHNDDFRGRTTKGTPIEKVDMIKAFNDAKMFYFKIITESIINADNVFISYSKGNHDETVAWFFFQVLKQAYSGQADFDDSLLMRKCYHWHNIFIGYGHCDEGKVGAKDIAMQFTIEYPQEFAGSTVRELHLGHLHRESEYGDTTGIMVRRLSTKNQTDDWHKNNGYVGNHKRFMLFEYDYNNLKSIHYV